MSRRRTISAAEYTALVRLRALASQAREAYTVALQPFMSPSQALGARTAYLPGVVEAMAAECLPAALTHTADGPARELADAAIDCVLSAH